MKKLIILTLAATMFASCGKKAEEDGFAWNKATVYFVLVDRFCNGDSTNDQQYGRCTDYGSERMNASTFHGGDYAGLLQKAKEGYFTDLGVDVVWLTDPYEQVHGWVPGSGWVVNDFPHYGYHGYYPLDYTQMDKNFGTIEEYRALIDELHAQGIRVMEGANINDIGYPTYLDALQQGFATVPGIDTETAAVEHRRDINYDAWLEAMYDQPDWYTTEWLRRVPGAFSRRNGRSGLRLRGLLLRRCALSINRSDFLRTSRSGCNAALITPQYGATLIRQAITRRSMGTSSGTKAKRGNPLSFWTTSGAFPDRRSFPMSS